MKSKLNPTICPNPFHI